MDHKIQRSWKIELDEQIKDQHLKAQIDIIQYFVEKYIISEITNLFRNLAAHVN